MRHTAIGVAAAAAAVIGSIALAPAAQADTDVDGHYRQMTSDLRCTGIVQAPNLEPGHLTVTVRGGETRPDDGLFRTAVVATRLLGQKRIDGDWVTVNRSGLKFAELGATRDRGEKNYAPFKWTGMNNPTHPRMRVDAPSTGVYRVVTISRPYNIDGVQLATLRTVEGTCAVDSTR